MSAVDQGTIANSSSSSVCTRRTAKELASSSQDVDQARSVADRSTTAEPSGTGARDDVTSSMESDSSTYQDVDSRGSAASHATLAR